MRRALWILLGLAVLVAVVWQWWKGPDPAEILARIEVPSAPVLSPDEELATFPISRVE